MPVLLKTRDLDRIADAVELVEVTPQNRKTANRAPGPIHQSGDEQTVRVSSTTTTDGRYPGYLVQLDPSTGSYADLCDIWVIEINGGTLAVQRYRGRRNGTADGTDATNAVFEVELGGGGSGKLRGTLTSTLNFGSSATMTIAGTSTSITVYDWLLSSGQSVASGIQVTVFFDSAAAGLYYVDGAQCTS